MLSQSEQKAMVERQALLYIGYIVEGIEGDYLRQLIHNQIIHYCVKFDLNDEGSSNDLSSGTTSESSLNFNQGTEPTQLNMFDDINP